MMSSKPTTIIASVTMFAASVMLTIAAFAGPPISVISPMARSVISPLATHMSAPTRTTTPTAPAKAAPTHTERMANTTHTTGQPNQTCGSATAPLTPGNASTAPGSVFNANGTSGGVYAGQQPQNSVNPTSVSQYDVACSKQK